MVWPLWGSPRRLIRCRFTPAGAVKAPAASLDSANAWIAGWSLSRMLRSLSQLLFICGKSSRSKLCAPVTRSFPLALPISPFRLLPSSRGFDTSGPPMGGQNPKRVLSNHRRKYESIPNCTGPDGRSPASGGLLQQLFLQSVCGPGLHGMQLPLQPLIVRAE